MNILIKFLKLALLFTVAISNRKNRYKDDFLNEVEFFNKVTWPEDAFQRNGLSARVMAVNEKGLNSSEKRDCSKQIRMLESDVKCKPRDTMVDVIAPIGESIVPKKVIVKRCIGTSRPPFSCMPKKSENKTIHVRKVAGRGGFSVCSKIAVSEDTECVSECKVKESSCNKKIQSYEKEKCKCFCKNSGEYKKCKNNLNRNMVWDEETCTCMCKKKEECSTHTFWVPEMCKCAFVMVVKS